MKEAEPEEASLGERPPEDDLALSVAESRIASRLFGVSSEVLVGRYRLLELVGRGGMGVVWGAYDPELERKVAIKLVDPLKPTARDRLVGEARALAKLSHPNVVAIYDVGVVDDRVYIVMEWVAGKDLRAHLVEEPRPPREIVDLFTQAARGLAAVHAANLVHRDFKPDNAVVGSDGRVRVLDFGLARADVDTNKDIAGTPRYMAPEQRAGAPPTPAVDQFALCVALREALEAGDRQAPAWLAAIIARGTAEKPADRFPSIDDVIRALGRDPARVWRRRILVGAALVATASAFVVGRAAERSSCDDAGRDVIAPATRARVAAHLTELGGIAAQERDSLLALLDAQQRALGTAQREACVAHAGGRLTTGLYERNLTCLARAESSLSTSAEILVGATASTFPDARVALGALADPASCARVDESLIPLPDERDVGGVRAVEVAVERARMLATALRPEAADAATGARIAAETIGYAPLVARALLAEGRAQMFASDARAAATLDRAMRAGFIARDDATTVEAFARAAYVTALSNGRPLDGATVIDAVAARLAPQGEFARQLLLNNLAVVKMVTSDDPRGARDLLESAMRAWRPARGENDYELGSIPLNLALVVDTPARSLELLARARDEVVRLFGMEHPRALQIDFARAPFLPLARARQTNDEACERVARSFPHLHNDIQDCAYESAWLADEAGDRAAARAHLALARNQPEVHALRTQIEDALLAETPTGEMARALEVAADRESHVESLFSRFVAADGYMAAAHLWDTLNEPAKSRRALLGALPLLEAMGRPATARRLARVRATLAKTEPDRARAIGYAREALGWYRQIGEEAADLERVVGAQ